MSAPGKEKRMKADGLLSEAMDRNEVEAIFHKDSYMKGLKNMAETKSDKGALQQAFGNSILPLSLLGNENKGEKLEQCQIYKWVDPATEAKAILNSSKITKGTVERRERKRYNDQLSYGKGDYKWVEVPENERNDPFEQLAEGKFRLVPKIKMKRPIRKSSYLSWILEPESPCSQYTRVYSLPPYEEDFWKSMLSTGNPAKGIDPGYLTLDKAGFQSKENLFLINNL